jgi:hypothetical protein
MAIQHAMIRIKNHIYFLKKDGRMVRTNIHEMARNLKYRKEMGD